MIARLYLPIPEHSTGALTLTGDELFYLQRVLRARQGEQVQLFNGSGFRSDRTIEAISRSEAVLGAGSWLQGLSPALPSLHLIQGLIASEKMDWAIEKAVELGAASIRPLATARSLAKLDASRALTRLEHWQRLAIAACRQCGRDRLPALWPVQPIGDYLQGLERRPTPAVPDGNEARVRLILTVPHEPAATPSLSEWARQSRPGLLQDIDLMVGPESGFSPQEIDLALELGFEPVRMGVFTLRAETAGLAALAALNALGRRD